MSQGDIILKVVVLVGLLKAIRYPINSPLVCAIIWFVARFSSGIFASEDLIINTIKSLVAFGFSFWMFKTIKWQPVKTLRWFTIVVLGGSVLVFIL